MQLQLTIPTQLQLQLIIPTQLQLMLYLRSAAMFLQFAVTFVAMPTPQALSPPRCRQQFLL